MPNAEPMPSVRCSQPSYSSGRHSPKRTTPLERTHSPERSPSSSEASLRAKSRSPSKKHPSSEILGYKFEELRFIRLIPNINQNKIFELQRYTFPTDKRINLRTANGVLIPMPSEEQTVLTASNGDVFAILAKKPNRQMILRGMYKPVTYTGKRAKININSGAVVEMTSEEIAESPLGNHNVVPKRFKIFRVETV
ncbi:uncharacterized protein LOC117168007 [Belonocnema kinseyi]|uniref:uncharacterized protein LOC117168007 n=1 Tax=Belonocnema kinseyi TaxID=2817044 RepID=UPI00143D8785|nr:uncharacterized protein LOC117168007 [Belonocnema kinseyi]